MSNHVIPLLKAINRSPELIIRSINEIPFPSISPFLIGIIHFHIIYDDYCLFDNINGSSAYHQTHTLIKDIIFNETNLYNDYLIACAAEVAAWAIILKAHIAAAEGL